MKLLVSPQEAPHGVCGGFTSPLWGRTLGGVTNTTPGSVVSLPNSNLVSILPSCQVGRLRHRQVKCLVGGHIASKWRGWDSAQAAEA